MKTLINNFLNGEPIKLVNAIYDGSPLIHILQRNGAMSFLHTLRPDQAREMAAALIAHADAVEKELQDAQNIV